MAHAHCVPSQLLLRCYAKESQLAVPQRRGGGYLLGEEWIRPGWTGTPLVLVRNEGSPECRSSAHPRRWGALRVRAVRGLSLRRDPRAGLRRPRVAVITTSHGWKSTSPRYQGGTADGSPLFPRSRASCRRVTSQSLSRVDKLNRAFRGVVDVVDLAGDELPLLRPHRARFVEDVLRIRGRRWLRRRPGRHRR
jgi:hypothetical protein